MAKPSLRLIVPSAMLVVFAVVTVVALQSVDDPDARAAYAEYLTVRDAREKAEEQVKVALAYRDFPDVDRLQVQRIEREAKALVSETTDRAQQLETEWSGRWQRLGLDVK